ncbi:hypothetical protein QE416_000434 [Microbacterium sp. SORGH_AS 421]|nr:hypothetical protein [Microbacterium sp. SORGH_AS_0421]
MHAHARRARGIQARVEVGSRVDPDPVDEDGGSGVGEAHARRAVAVHRKTQAVDAQGRPHVLADGGCIRHLAERSHRHRARPVGRVSDGDVCSGRRRGRSAHRLRGDRAFGLQAGSARDQRGPVRCCDGDARDEGGRRRSRGSTRHHAETHAPDLRPPRFGLDPQGRHLGSTAVDGAFCDDQPRRPPRGGRRQRDRVSRRQLRRIQDVLAVDRQRVEGHRRAPVGPAAGTQTGEGDRDAVAQLEQAAVDSRLRSVRGRSGGQPGRAGGVELQHVSGLREGVVDGRPAGPFAEGRGLLERTAVGIEDLDAGGRGRGDRHRSVRGDGARDGGCRDEGTDDGGEKPGTGSRGHWSAPNRSRKSAPFGMPTPVTGSHPAAVCRDWGRVSHR